MRRLFRFLANALVWLLAVLVIVVSGFRIAAEWRETADASALAPATGRFVTTRSGRIFMQEAGPRDGIPVLLFHGTAAWSELWRGTMTALAAAGFRAIAFDIPPFGFSDRRGAYTRVDQAERARELLDGLEIPSALIVGHSFGAGAAVETAMRYPGRARGLVLVDAALGLAPGVLAASAPPFPFQFAWVREAAVSLTITNPLATRLLLSTLIAKKERALPGYVAILQRPLPVKNTTRDVGQWLGYFLSSDNLAQSADRRSYATLKMKTAILWGDQDTVTPLAQGEALRALIPGATLTLLPGIGHIPQIEDPEVFHRALVAQLLAMK